MEQERLSWQQIKKRYPHRYVGLSEIESGENGVDVKSAVVACTDETNSYSELVKMAFHGKIFLLYTVVLMSCFHFTKIP